MQTPSPAMRDLAGRLIAAGRLAADPQNHELRVVTEKLRDGLIRFSGVDGFASLLRRALTLAGREFSSLELLRVDAEGHLEGIEHLAGESGTGGGSRAAVAATEQLLELLGTFVGESLTMRLIHVAWPEAFLDDHTPRNEEKR